ncbi:MAG: PilN domain-containing protein [Kiritimatiellae bacterium]|nr:PilN domain-containing protein [Kiritimatiellia bacterium]
MNRSWGRWWPEVAAVRTVTAVRRTADSLVWTQIRLRRDGRAVAPETRALPLPPLDPDASAEVAAAALRPALEQLHGELSLLLPADRALMRVLELPSEDPAELADMAALQLDRISPFPVEHLVIGHEVFASGAGRSRVLVAAMPRELVEREAALFRAVGRDVRRVDLDVLAWWHHLAAVSGAEDGGLRVHLRIEAATARVLAVRAGRPLIVRALAAGGDAPEELEHELELTFAALETEWGVAPEGELIVWFDGEPDASLTSRLAAVCGLPATATRLEELPPLTEGAAQRALADPARTLNLAPPEWEEVRRHRSRTRRFAAAAGVCLGLWLLLVVGFLVALYVREASVARLARFVEVLEKPAAEVRAVQARIRSLEEYGDRTRSALEILRQISADLPPGLTLTSFSFRKGRSVNLRGEAEAVNAVYDFFAALERSGLFREVKPEGVTSRPSAGRAKSEFRVTAVLPGEETPG